MTAMLTNGQARKSLAEQIDKLDHLLDGFGDALNDSVTQAVKDAVGLAVQEAVTTVLREVLANPELLARLPNVTGNASVENAAAQTTSAPTLGLGQRLKQVGRWIGRKVAAVKQRCGQLLNAAIENGTALCQALGSACRQRIARFRETILTGMRRSRQFVTEYAQVAWRLRRSLVAVAVALGVGSAVAVAAFWCGPWVASAASGLGGFGTALAVQTGLRR